ETPLGTEGVLTEVVLSAPGRFATFDDLVTLTVQAADSDERHGPFLSKGGYEDEAQCDIHRSPSPLLKHYPTELRGGTCHRSAKASGGEDLQVEEPVACWDCASFHFHATLAGMLGPTLIRDEVVQVGEPGEKRLLASTRMMESLHREQFALDSIMG